MRVAVLCFRCHGARSNLAVLVLLCCCESNIRSQQCEWPCYVARKDASSNPTVVLLLYCESNSSSQHQWRCCSSPSHRTSDSLTVVLLLHCIATVLAVTCASGRVVGDVMLRVQE